MLGGLIIGPPEDDDEESPPSSKRPTGKPPAGFSGSVLRALPGLSDSQVQSLYEAICLACGKDMGDYDEE